MSTEPEKNDRDLTAPFLVQLFHRTGAFHRPDEFAAQFPPPHISIYTWPSCTLNELALELAASKPSALPSPAIGTRLSFQLVCPDLRGTSATSTSNPRFAVKDMGSIVIGEGGPGIEDLDDGDFDRNEDVSHKTLAEARFVVGDFISCAVFPPLPDGSVAPPPSARRGSISSGRETRGGSRGLFGAREDSFGRNSGRQGRGGRRDVGFPTGDWRRGEKLPDGPPGRSRGRGRW